MLNVQPTLSIGQNMLKIRAALIEHPATVSLKPDNIKVGQRIFTAELAALVFAVCPPEVKQGARNPVRTKVANNISRITGGSVEAIKKIWSGESHRNASLAAQKLSTERIREFAEKCRISELPYIQKITGL